MYFVKFYRLTTLREKVSIFGVILIGIFVVFSRIRTEYGEIRSISLNAGKMREKCGPQKLRIRTLFMQC